MVQARLGLGLGSRRVEVNQTLGDWNRSEKLNPFPQEGQGVKQDDPHEEKLSGFQRGRQAGRSPPTPPQGSSTCSGGFQRNMTILAL